MDVAAVIQTNTHSITRFLPFSLINYRFIINAAFMQLFPCRFHRTHARPHAKLARSPSLVLRVIVCVSVFNEDGRIYSPKFFFPPLLINRSQSAIANRFHPSTGPIARTQRAGVRRNRLHTQTDSAVLNGIVRVK